MLDWNNEIYPENEKPLDRLVQRYSNTSIFRSIAVIGDSLASGEFETRDKNDKPTYYDMYEYSWGQFLARQNGLQAYNFSKGGMTAKKYIESFAEENGFWDKEKACQAYIIALGVNDVFFSDIEFGNIDDVDVKNYKNNKHTFIGYYSMIISRYKEISPDAKFFFVSFPNTNNPERTQIQINMVETLNKLCEIFDNSYVIDLYNYGPVYDEKFEEKFFLNGHMNPSGYLFTAKIIDSYIDFLIRHNPEEFKNVGFINSGVVINNACK